MDLLVDDALADKILVALNESRAVAGQHGLQSAFAEASNDHVYKQAVSLTIPATTDGGDVETACVEAVKSLLSTSPETPALSRFATHADVVLGSGGEDGDEKTLRLEVFFKYLELPTVGPVIDGDLVVQGNCLSTELLPAVCRVDFAADHEESMVEAAVIAPWMMMYTASENPNEKNSEFAVPISLGQEHREGHVRVRVFLDVAENIPYGEEKDDYLEAFRADAKGERFVCALDFTTRATSSGQAEGEGEGADEAVAAAAAAAWGDGAAAQVGGDAWADAGSAPPSRGQKRGGKRGGKRSPSSRAQAQEALANTPVVVSVKLAVGFDEVEALRSEGFQLSCAHLDADGALREEDEEGKWGFFLLAKFGDVPAPAAPATAPPAPAAASAAETEAAGEEKGDGETKQGDGPGPASDVADAPPSSEEPTQEPLPVASVEILEDVIFVEVPREVLTEIAAAGEGAGGAPDSAALAAALRDRGLLPDGYDLLPTDLSASARPAPTPDADTEAGAGAGAEEGTGASSSHAVFIAFKLVQSSSTSARVSGLSMFSVASADDSADAALPSFLGSRPGLALKAAPAAVAAGAEAVSGILVRRFTLDATDGLLGEDEGEWLDDDEGLGLDEEEGEEAGAGRAFLEEKDDSTPRLMNRLSLDAGSVVSAGGAGGSVPHSHRDGEQDDDEPDLAGVVEEDEDESAVLERLQARTAALTAERDALAATNSDLQRKAAALMAREKALLQGQTRAGTAAEEPPAKEEDGPKEEHLQEKEKQFTEILGHILEGRKKASQQQLEYDQLALDLQTRLDDREFKAGEIYESFKAFKKEILLKAENSRTSKPMSKRLIAQFEAAELKREEDLERVRLRNISMRTQLKKMEKTLRAREQLAEGLYMIDFEQLKVENQTLYEKIEERSEEVVKLKRKKTVTVQTLTHVREKLRFIENANVQLNRELCEVENLTMSRRGELTSTKKQRDVVRDDNKELRLKQGFSSSTGLITDYESRKSKLEDVKAEIEELKSRYEMLSRQAGVGLDSSKK